MRIVVTGVKASGKGTTCQLVKKEMPEVKVVSIGDYFEFVFAKQMPSKKGKREIFEEVSREEGLKLQEKAARMLVEETKDAEHVLIDSNLFFSGPKGFMPGLPEHMLKILNPDVIVVLDVGPEDILKRRLKDEKVKDHEVTEAGTIRRHRIRHASKEIKTIEFERDIMNMYAFAYSSLVGCSVKIIDLTFREKEPIEHGKIAAKEIVKMLKGKS